ncbi:transporter substrate-binding domain-containing protein [Nostoc sphaeroides]|uniref:Basic amino acid ABC transporter substrate-binding protein n=1 Tax=Nostoc sphaeroides CCNUC1 TaxID=2653204 RepID=A0A5P8VSI9_9NOSO|nr:transporter substrate-binding domain-containing protein [Nostoc sphaeroides]QFS43166.1 basic amino acid ABC transporter substrate-binding protein [Nostoc sphaeroides CCNUC1]
MKILKTSIVSKVKKIAVQIGSTGADFAKTIPNAKISTFSSGPEFFQDLLNGNIDAVVSDAFATLYAIKNGKLQGIRVVADLLTQEYYGIATPKDSPHLDAINKGIAQYSSVKPKNLGKDAKFRVSTGLKLVPKILN